MSANEKQVRQCIHELEQIKALAQDKTAKGQVAAIPNWAVTLVTILIAFLQSLITPPPPTPPGPSGPQS